MIDFLQYGTSRKLGWAKVNKKKAFKLQVLIICSTSLPLFLSHCSCHCELSQVVLQTIYSELRVQKPNILKADVLDVRTPQKIQISRRKISENVKIISLSPWKLTILQCVTNKGQEVLKNLAKKPKISDYHVFGVRYFYILLSNGTFLDFLLIYALL